MKKSTILMLGDSLIDYGHWQSRLPQCHVIARGVPGEYAEELLWRLPHKNNLQQVDTILLMTGTNNLITGTSDFFGTMTKIVSTLQNDYPKAVIILNSLLPIKIIGFESLISQSNDKITAIAKASGVYYFDLYTPFTQSRDELFDFDGVHLSEAGYKLWAQLLSEEMSTLLAKDCD